MSLLKIENLSATVGGKKVLNGLSLTLNAGEVHAIMGPNGSGKSTLSYVLAGRPGYEITGGSVQFEGQDLTTLAPEERARAGLFLGFEREQVTALELHAATGDLVARAAGEHIGQRALARAIGTHDGVHFARVHRQRQSVQHVLAAHLGG